MKRKYIFLVAVSIFIIAIDQATKLYIDTHFYLRESMSVIPNFFSITYVRNPGAAFGLGSGAHPVFREIFFLSMPPLALLFILMLLRSVSNKDTWQIVALSCIFGGAIGNYIDRLRFRAVIDFLDFYYRCSDCTERFYTYPTFNVADIAIVTGVSLLLLLMYLRRDEAEAKQPKKKTASA